MIDMNKKIWLCMFLCLVSQVKVQAEATLTVSDFSIEAGGRATITIDSDVALNEYCSFQFDVLLPEGITMPYTMNPDEEEEQYGYYNEDEEEWIPAVESGICKSSHVLEYSAIKGGYRFVCYNSKFATFKTGSKNVLTLVLEASEEMVNGVYSIAVGGKDVFIANENSHIIPSSVSGTAIVTGSSQELSYQYSMSSAGWGTLMLPFDAEVPAGLTAYVCATISNGMLELVPSTTLIANTPYVMEGEYGKYNFAGIPTMMKTSYNSGVLTGVYANTKISEGYVLQQLNGDVAFYRVDASDPITVPAFRCYLNTPTESVPMLRLRGETTEIIDVNINMMKDLYNIQGEKIVVPERGVYIQGNRKIIIK